MKLFEEYGSWRKLDNTAKIFPVIANENLSNVFRLSVTLNHNIIPDLLEAALEEVLPQFEGFRVRLRKGFFWYYFEENKRKPLIEQEETFPCKYIDAHMNQQYLFRLSYYENRINLEVFHAMSDGLGSVRFLLAIAYRYLDRSIGKTDMVKSMDFGENNQSSYVEDGYLKHYKSAKATKYSSKKAYELEGEHLPFGGVNVVHGYAKLGPLKAASKSYGVSVTKFLVACVIWSVYEVCLKGKPCKNAIGISLPVNLRSFFDSETMANFFVVTVIEFFSTGLDHTFEEVLQFVSGQMDEKIVKEKLEQTIAYNVSSEKKWYVRGMPLLVKWVAFNMVFKRNDRAYTMTLSNIGVLKVEPEYEAFIRRFHMLIGVSKRQPMKCSVCTYGEEVVVSFSSVFKDDQLQKRFFSCLEEHEIPVEIEGNGMVDPEENQGMYPKISYDEKKWKWLAFGFYGALCLIAAILGVINYATYSGMMWSVIAVGGIAYAGVTVRYSILHTANLGAKILVQTLGVQVFMVLIDVVLGYQGWSVNIGIPSSILFADVLVMFLIGINRLNWQSYFMYQIALTIFSFLPVVFWMIGWIEQPLMMVITMVVSIGLLLLTIVMGDKSVKHELIKRFHL